jgi:hypothetical protein
MEYFDQTTNGRVTINNLHINYGRGALLKSGESSVTHRTTAISAFINKKDSSNSSFYGQDLDANLSPILQPAGGRHILPRITNYKLSGETYNDKVMVLPEPILANKQIYQQRQRNQKSVNRDLKDVDTDKAKELNQRVINLNLTEILEMAPGSTPSPQAGETFMI